MVNQGQTKFEAVSERLGAKATKIVLTKLDEWKNGIKGTLTEAERMTLLAGDLMIIQFKVSFRASSLTLDLPGRCMGI